MQHMTVMTQQLQHPVKSCGITGLRNAMLHIATFCTQMLIAFQQ
ncbi:MAG: hypothetical protein Q8O31_05285 [Rhodocyclaceae bacterium]|nr:hypothetical protein [Rhodocyclaceae bacterium]